MSSKTTYFGPGVELVVKHLHNFRRLIVHHFGEFFIPENRDRILSSGVVALFVQLAHCRKA